MGTLAVLLLVGGALGGLMTLGDFDVPDDAATGNNGADDEATTKGADLLTGTDSADALAGGDGGDWILGFDGDDTIDGQSGNDVLIGGTGSDVIAGGTGDDFVESANVVDETLLRNSSATADDVFGVDFDYDLPAASDAGDDVSLGDGDDTIVAGSDDTVTGGKGADEFALGDWIDGGKPVEIEDFDEAEDVITFVYDRQGAEPELSVEVNEITGITTIKADGAAIAVLRDTSPDFSVKNIAVGRYAA